MINKKIVLEIVKKELTKLGADLDSIVIKYEDKKYNVTFKYRWSNSTNLVPFHENFINKKIKEIRNEKINGIIK